MTEDEFRTLVTEWRQLATERELANARAARLAERVATLDAQTPAVWPSLAALHRHRAERAALELQRRNVACTSERRLSEVEWLIRQELGAGHYVRVGGIVIGICDGQVVEGMPEIEEVAV